MASHLARTRRRTTTATTSRASRWRSGRWSAPRCVRAPARASFVPPLADACTRTPPLCPAAGHKSVPGPLAECWDEPDSTSYMIRGANYLKDRIKVLSSPAVYQAVAVDAFTSPARLDHVMRRLRLPEPNPALGPARPPPGTPSAGVLPRFFVLNIQIPQYEPRLLGSPGNGFGLSVVLIHELVDHGARVSPQLRPLLERFFRNEVEPSGEPSRERLKYIPRICNLADVSSHCGFSRAEKSLMASYDGKPVMTKPQHRFFRGPGYLEVDLDTHGYSFVARKGVYSYSRQLDHFVFDLACVLQGGTPDELPEQVLCCSRVANLSYARQRGPPVPLPPPSPELEAAARKASKSAAKGAAEAGGAAGGGVSDAPRGTPPAETS